VVVDKPFCINGAFSYTHPCYADDKDGFFDLSKPCCKDCGVLCNVVWCAPRVSMDEVIFNSVAIEHPGVCKKDRVVRTRYFKNNLGFPYKSVWKYFYSPRIVGKPTPQGIGDSIKYRLFNCREGNKKLDSDLFKNQRRSSRNPYLWSVLHLIKQRMYSAFYLDQFVIEMQQWYALDPTHEKYKLRSTTWREAVMNGEIHVLKEWIKIEAVRTLKQVVTAKPKIEWAKVGKPIRNIVDLTSLGSLAAGFPIKIFKKIFGEYTDEQWWRFVSEPNLLILKETFEFLRDPPTFAFVFFSDDSCLSVRTLEGKLFRCNMDIKSADGSAGPKIFDIIDWMFRDSLSYPFVKIAINQCSLPLRFTNPYFRWWQEVTPMRPILYSGSVLTTIVNNFGNLMIACEIKRKIDCGLWKYSDCARMLKICAGRAGYLVEIQECASIEHFQFLKFSPDKNCNPFLNLGVLLRCVGSCDGDLPGKGTFEERAKKRDQEVVASFVHAGKHALTLAFRSWGVSDTVSFSSEAISRVYAANGELQEFVICEDSILTRYGLCRSEWLLLTKLTACMRFGCCIDTSASRKIFNLDYGYEYE
jgi:hypothetical protein